jgi:hypothetical protein
MWGSSRENARSSMSTWLERQPASNGKWLSKKFRDEDIVADRRRLLIAAACLANHLHDQVDQSDKRLTPNPPPAGTQALRHARQTEVKG